MAALLPPPSRPHKPRRRGPQPRPEPRIARGDEQNFTVTAPGELQIVGSEELYDINLPTDLLFDFDEAELRPEAEPLLRQLKQHLSTHQTDQIHVRGHTDGQGDETYNYRLSLRRAGAVCDWLKAEYRDGFYNCLGLGETEPLRPETNPDGSDNPLNRQLNRRVQLRIVAYPDVNAMMDQAGRRARAATERLEAGARDPGLN